MTFDNERVNTAFIGFFLIGFFLLLLGVLGLQYGELFGSYKNYHDMPIDVSVLNHIGFLLGAVLLLLTVFAYRIGNKHGAYYFAFFAVVLIATAYTEEYSANSNWFMYVAIAIFFLVMTLYLVLGEAYKLIGVLTFMLAVIFFLIGMAAFFFVTGPGSGNPDTFKTMAIVYGIISLLAFALSTYIGLALAKREKLPLI